MSTDATIATVGTTGTTASTDDVRHQSYRCYNCHCSFRISTSAAPAFRCPGCHRRNRRYIHRQRHIIPLASHPSNPNPSRSANYPSISIYGPFYPYSTQTPLHTSDYIDSDDEDLFDSILDRIASEHQEQHQTSHLSPTSKSFIDSLPIVKITGSLSKSCSRSCSICKDEFDGNGKVNQLPCKHVFHHECIVPWLNRSNSCPLCRYKMPAERRRRSLMLYLVRVGNLYVEGWGEDHESGFRDAVLRNGLFAVLSRQSSASSSSWSSTRMGRAQMDSVGLASSEDTVSSPSVEREGHVDGAASVLANGDVNVVLDADGDTVMLDA